MDKEILVLDTPDEEVKKVLFNLGVEGDEYGDLADYIKKQWAEVDALKEKLYERPTEKYLIFGYDLESGEPFSFLADERPEPVDFAVSFLRAMYSYDEETKQYWNRAGEALLEQITDREEKGWTLWAPYDGTIEGAYVECQRLQEVRKWNDS